MPHNALDQQASDTDTTSAIEEAYSTQAVSYGTQAGVPPPDVGRSNQPFEVRCDFGPRPGAGRSYDEEEALIDALIERHRAALQGLAAR